MSDDEIETLNRECLMYEMKRDNSQEFISILNDLKRATNERAGFLCYNGKQEQLQDAGRDNVKF